MNLRCAYPEGVKFRSLFAAILCALALILLTVQNLALAAGGRSRGANSSAGGSHGGAGHAGTGRSAGARSRATGSSRPTANRASGGGHGGRARPGKRARQAGVASQQTAALVRSASKRAKAGVERDAGGRIKRSAMARAHFQNEHPCPSTGRTSGRCPGYVVDHVRALKRGGADQPGNMQWQRKQAARAKDRTE